MSDYLRAQPGGQLLSLPSEVRLIIYELIFTPCKTDLYDAAAGFPWGPDNHNRHPALLATCRIIYIEAKPVLYENTEFNVWCSYRMNGEIADTEDAISEDSLSDDSSSDDAMSEETRSENKSPEESSSDDPKLPEAILGAKPLIHEMRKLSLEIELTDADRWADVEEKGKWYKRLTSELILLLEAPHLKQVHLELSATNGPGVAAELDRMINLLSRVMHRFVPTISIDSSLRLTDFELSTYFDLIAKLKWVDTTHQVYSENLAGLGKKSLHILHKIQSLSTSIATKSAEHRDMLNNDNFYVRDAVLRERALSISEEIWTKNDQIFRWKDDFDDLAMKIASVEDDLGWIEAGRSALADAEMAVPEDVPIAVD